MPNFQELHIEGHLGGDADFKYTQAGKTVATFSVAVNPFTREGEPAKPPVWFRVTAWDALAEGAKNLRKGAAVCIFGTVSASAYTNKEGMPAASLEVTARRIFVGLDMPRPSETGQFEDIPF